MTLRSLWFRLRGYVIIRVSGKAVEGFINEAYMSGLELWDLHRIDGRSILCSVYLKDLPEIGQALKRTGCAGRIERKIGLPFLMMKLTRRKGLAIGLILFSVVLYALSSFVWFVDVIGCDKVSPDAIIEFAAMQGVKAGVPRRKIDSAELSKAILAEFTGLAWVGVHVRGTTVSIEVAEKTLPEAKPGIVHLVAAEDALVTNMIILAGEPCVSEGETVSKGQILVAGVVLPSYGYEGEEADTRRVINAKGVVMGRVWRTHQDALDLIQEFEAETGRVERSIRLAFGPYEVRIGPERPRFQSYNEDLSVWKIPLPGRSEPLIFGSAATYRETEKFAVVLDKERALEDLKITASTHLKAKIPKAAKILDEQEKLEYSEEGKWVYTLTIETLEDIAQERREDRGVD